MLLQKILLLFMLGLAVLFCAVGCDENASMQTGPASTARPVNNQPGSAVELPSPATQPASAENPATQPADAPVAIRKPDAAAMPAAEPQPAAGVENAQPDSLQNIPPQHVQLYDSLKQQSLKLQMKIDELQEQNEKLTRALVDAREVGRTQQDNYQRSTIVQEIQKRELLELKEQLGQVSAKPAAGSSAGSVAPVEPGQAMAQGDSTNLMLQLAQLRRANEKLQLQLRLAKLDTPDARQKVLVQLGETIEQNEKLEKINRELSHMVVTQSDEIRSLQKRQDESSQQQTDHAEQIARMDRRTRKELATLEIQLAESRKLIATLKNDVAQRDYQIRTLNEQIATAPAQKKDRPAARPVLVKVAAIETASTAAPTAAKQIAQNESSTVSDEQPVIAAAVKADLAPAKTVVAPPVTRREITQPIAGRITAINGLMVMVDVGKDFGLEEGMRLISYREDKFVGYLRVEQVNTREAVCTFSRQILPPQVGDHVVDRLE